MRWQLRKTEYKIFMCISPSFLAKFHHLSLDFQRSRAQLYDPGPSSVPARSDIQPSPSRSIVAHRAPIGQVSPPPASHIGKLAWSAKAAVSRRLSGARWAFMAYPSNWPSLNQSVQRPAGRGAESNAFPHQLGSLHARRARSNLLWLVS